MIRAAKFRAKKKGLPYDLDEHRAEIIVRVTAGFCELTGLEFAFGEGRVWNSPSIDRVEGGQGYLYPNVRIILWSLNCAFSYWGEDRMEMISKAWLERRPTC